MVLVADSALRVRQQRSSGDDFADLLGRPLADLAFLGPEVIAAAGRIVAGAGPEIVGSVQGRTVCLAPGPHGGVVLTLNDPSVEAPEALQQARLGFLNGFRVMRAVIRRSAYQSQALEPHFSELEGRLDVMSRVLSAQIREPEARFPLSRLIYDALDEAGKAQQNCIFRVAGPPVLVSERAALTLALLFHELAVESCLAGETARAVENCLTVSWKVQDTELHLEWAETGRMSPANVPSRALRIAKEMIAYELDGRATQRALSDGVVTHLRLPCAALSASGHRGVSVQPED